MEMVSKSTEETKELGRKIADKLKAEGLKLKAERAKIFALTGDLGSGKTTFVQGLAEGLGMGQRIVSPTFIIVRKYDIDVRGQTLEVRNFYHVDLYRLEDNLEQEIANLGLKEIWSDPGNIVAIEWAEKIKDTLPEGAVWVEFKNAGKDVRKIKVSSS